MQTIPLYRYIRPDGGVTVSPVKPDTDYVAMCRLVAEAGCILTNGEDTTVCVDTDNPNEWYEVQDAEA